MQRKQEILNKLLYPAAISSWREVSGLSLLLGHMTRRFFYLLMSSDHNRVFSKFPFALPALCKDLAG